MLPVPVTIKIGFSLQFMALYYYYYYYYHRKKRFQWHNVKRLQGHITNTKQNSTSATQQNEKVFIRYSQWQSCKVEPYCSLEPMLSDWFVDCVSLHYSRTMLAVLVARFLESHWFVWATQMSHLPMHIDYDGNEDWVTTQLRASCNVEHSLFNDWWSGHLNFQIEHQSVIVPVSRSSCIDNNNNNNW